MEITQRVLATIKPVGIAAYTWLYKQQPGKVMEELHRVLRDEGTLLFSDHHMKHEDILYEITKHGLFQLFKRGNKVYSFIKVD